MKSPFQCLQFPRYRPENDLLKPSRHWNLLGGLLQDQALASEQGEVQVLGQIQDRIQNQEVPRGLETVPASEQEKEPLQQQLRDLNRLMNMKNMSTMTIN